MNYYKNTKRFFDISFSIILFVVIFPLIFIFAILIILIDKQSPFFVQDRSGINGKEIKIYKLRSMKFNGNENKITLLGKFLRITKIDEIPQLINVIKNDMSIIGPRPLYNEFNLYYKKKHKLRLKTKPGITGLAQIKIRDSTNWSRKFNFDYIYVKKCNFSLDIYILLNTLAIVLKSIFFKSERYKETVDYKKSFFQNSTRLLFWRVEFTANDK